MTPNSVALYFVVTIPLVLRQDYPCPFRYKGQPDLVQGAALMKIAMTPKLHIIGNQDINDGLAVV